MLLPLAAFFLVTALFYGLASLFMRSRKSRESEVLAGGRLRPLIFGPLTHALAWVFPWDIRLPSNPPLVRHYFERHQTAHKTFGQFRMPCNSRRLARRVIWF